MICKNLSPAVLVLKTHYGKESAFTEVDIPFNEEVARKAWDHFEYLGGRLLPRKRRLGFVAEALVQDYFNEPHCYEIEYDLGYDMTWEDIKVDIKNDICDYQYFPNGNTAFTVKPSCGELRADMYWFTKLDPKKKKCQVVGWLSKKEIIKYGNFYRKGEPIREFKNRPADYDCYIVHQKDMNVPLEKILTTDSSSVADI